MAHILYIQQRELEPDSAMERGRELVSNNQFDDLEVPFPMTAPQSSLFLIFMRAWETKTALIRSVPFRGEPNPDSSKEMCTR